MMKTTLSALALVISGLVVAGPSQAGTCTATFGNPNNPNVVVGSVDTHLRHDCNVPAGHPATRTFFGDTYTLALETDLNGGYVSGDQAITFSDPIANGESPGTWALNLHGGSFTSVLIGLKQSQLHAVFEVAGTSGTWFTTGPSSTTNGLSHSEIWYIAGSSTTPIPLPAGLPLLIGALGGLAYFRKSRRG